MEYNNQVLVENIHYLAKKNGRLLKDVAEELGVTAAYISRLKDQTSVPIDKVLKISEMFDVPVDVLMTTELKTVGDHNLYILKTIRSFIQKTEAKEIAWKKLDANTVAGYLSGKSFPTPNFSRLINQAGQSIYDTGPSIKEYRSYFMEPVLSQEGGCIDAEGKAIYPAMPWYQFTLDEHNVVFLTYMYLNEGTKCRPIIELYIETGETKSWIDERGYENFNEYYTNVPLCCSDIKESGLGETLETLYKVVSAHQYDIRISKDVMDALDKLIN